MAYLRLSNATTDSCDFKVKLSNDFNTNYYKKLRITSTNYGDSTSDIRRYVESITARTSSSRYVRGEVNDGMSAGNKYKLYAYAQAQNGTWYLAGSDTIRMEDDEGSKAFDYVIRDINTDKSEPFEIGDEVEFTVVVYNYKREEGPRYKVILKDMDGNRLDYDNEPSLDGKKTNNAYVSTRIKAEHINNDGKAEFKFVIESRDSGYIESDSGDNEETVEYAVSGTAGKPVLIVKDEILHLKHMSASGEPITEIETGRVYYGDMSVSEKEKWYKIKFSKSGKAIFILEPTKDLDADLYIYPFKEATNARASLKGMGEKDSVELDVTADIYYYINVRHWKGTGSFNLKCEGTGNPGYQNSTSSLIMQLEGEPFLTPRINDNGTITIGYGYDFKPDEDPDMFNKYLGKNAAGEVYVKSSMTESEARLTIKLVADKKNITSNLESFINGNGAGNNLSPLSLNQNQYDALFSYFYAAGGLVFTDRKYNEWIGYGGEHAIRAEARVELRDYIVNQNGNYDSQKVIDLFVNSKGANIKYTYEDRRRIEANLFNQ